MWSERIRIINTISKINWSILGPTNWSYNTDKKNLPNFIRITMHVGAGCPQYFSVGRSYIYIHSMWKDNIVGRWELNPTAPSDAVWMIKTKGPLEWNNGITLILPKKKKKKIYITLLSLHYNHALFTKGVINQKWCECYIL